MIVSMIMDACDGEEILAGASAGAQALSKLIGVVSEEYGMTVVVLDFKEISVATASFFARSSSGLSGLLPQQ